MSVVIWILIGLFAGYVANKIARLEGQTIPLMFLGVCGAMTGGFLYQVGIRSGDAVVNVWTLAIASTGAILGLLAHAAARRLGWIGIANR